MNKFLLMFLITVVLPSCKQIECNRLMAIGSDVTSRDAVLKWADDSIFSREFDWEDVTTDGKVLGPGEYEFLPDAIPPVPEVAFSQAAWVLSVRPLGKNPLKPEGIFLGERGYAGLIIVRTSVLAFAKDAGFSEDFPDAEFGRIAVTCR